ncbi:hypothetical protein OGAPHI_005962 [Ogataea philodendri]|uniref:Uncharacterized protein n=1 Tax=Ogataea philodendri TaxID=1378263 RepID=A0A9P8NZ94_9ASCO|nr:uncharacterized protein OGAPHI_005962 [Ogataea philodendri]KAH3661784.1 hypothetical protein OGAPHI_005962 [Ogataea philodendri]
MVKLLKVVEVLDLQSWNVHQYVSLIECMDNCGLPRSSVLTPSLALIMGPMVDPQGESFLTTNSCCGTLASAPICLSNTIPAELVTYRWLALILITGPWFNCGLFKLS